MRRPTPLLLAWAFAGGAFLSAWPATAQNDTNLPAPNVMLLVDSSGSMEYKASAATCPDGKPCFPVCYPSETNTGQHEKSRWIELLEVLTGSIDDYACFAQDRSSTDFYDEFRLGNVAPPDSQGRYSLPYHRPLSGSCAPGAGTLPPAGNPYAYPAGTFGRHTYNPGANLLNLGGPACGFNQASDGLLDSLSEQIRFGLMTFDTHPHHGDGLTGSSADYADGFAGAFSYYLDSVCPSIPPNITTNYCAGRPENCAFDLPMEVGARNAAAPPWEGRMVAFGPPNASTAEVVTRNQWVQNVLLSTRPYGATPLAGLLHDAQDFFWNDNTEDPLNSGQKFGPKDDPLLGPACRRNIIVVLSDGEPNLDLRPYCTGPGGVCPFKEPGEIAGELANDPDLKRRVRLYAVGFGVTEVDPEGNGTFTKCVDLPATDYCSNPLYTQHRELQACCTLNAIALNGTPIEEQGRENVLDHALFADDPDALRKALARVFSDALSKVTSRTRPVFTTSLGGSTLARGFQFFSAVNVKSLDLWQGELKRKRLICNATGVIDEIEPDESAGDDFIANVNSGNGAARVFYSVQPDPDGTARHSDRSLRPNLATNADGLGNYSGTPISNRSAAQLASDILPESMGLTDTTCGALSDTQCRDRYLRWLVGLENDTPEHRCRFPGSADCNLIADIFHSTPQIRGRPDEFLRDESYSSFQAALNGRDTVLYTSSNDGFFHAFLVAPGVTADPSAAAQREVRDKKNNELWAFLPPAVLPSIRAMYPNVHQRLLDGVPVIKDVVATKLNTTAASGYNYSLERTRADAESGGGTWRTIMVQSFGPMRGGYFALDITKPTLDNSDPESGPRFLWQLTKDAEGHEIFGKTGATPLITTVFMDTGGASAPIREVAVAVLPGGDGGLPTASDCNAGPALAVTPPAFVARNEVPCYDGDSVGARSLTVVRLDTGEVIRTFRPTGIAQPATFETSRIKEVEIPAPIVGEPAAFPATTGAVADRVFVGDREGRIWRLDVSNTDPDEWSFEIFFDAYSNPGTATVAQPIVMPPVLSVDDFGSITINVSTGDQEVLTQSPGMRNYLYSLTEKIGASEIRAEVNYRHTFDNGDRVIGPLSLFDRQLFFSSFSPGSAEACEAGRTAVYGVNYVTRAEEGSIDSGGLPALVDPVDPNNKVQSFTPIDGVIFGVALRQQPSCLIEDTGITDDPYLGYGTTSTRSFSRPGNFQLVIQIGGSTSAPPGQIVTQTIDLPNVTAPVRLESWAWILE